MTKPVSAEYAIGHTYSHGTLATTSYYDGATELLPADAEEIGLLSLMLQAEARCPHGVTKSVNTFRLPSRPLPCGAGR